MNPDLSFTDLTFRVDELELELSETKKELTSISNALKATQKELRECRDENDLALEEKDTTIKNLTDNVDLFREKLKYLTEQKEDLFSENLSLRKDLDTANQKLESAEKLKDSVEIMMQDIVVLTDKIEKKDEIISSKNDEITGLKAINKEVTEAYEQLKEYHRKDDNSFNHSFCDTSIEICRRQSMNNSSMKVESLAESILPTYHRDIEELKTTVSKLEATNRQIEDDFHNVKTMLDSKITEFRELEQDYNAVNNDMEKLKKMYSDMCDKSNILKEENICMESQLSVEKKKLWNAYKNRKILEKEIQDLKDDYRQFQELCKEAVKQLDEDRDILEKQKEAIEQQNNEIALCKTEIQSLKTIISDKEKEIDDYENKVQSLIDDICHKEAEMQRFEDKSHLLEEKFNEFTSTIRDSESKIKSLEGNLSTKDAELQNSNKKISSLEDVISQKDHEIGVHQNKAITLEKQHAKLQTRIQNLEKNIEYKNAVIEEFRSENQKFKEKLEFTELEMNSKLEASETLKNKAIEECNHLREEFQQKLREATHTHDCTKKLLDKEKAKLNKIVDQKERFEQFYNEEKLKFENEKKALVDKNKKVIDSLEHKLQELKDKFSKLEQSDLKRMEEKAEQISVLEDNIRKLNIVIAKLEDEKRIMKHDIEDLKSQSRLKDCQMERMSAMESTNLENFKSQEYSLKMKVETLERDLEKVREESNKHQESEKTLQEKNVKLNTYCRLLANKIEQQKSELDDLEEKLINANGKCVYLQKDYDFLKINMDLTEKNYKTLQLEKDKVSARNNELEATMIKLIQNKANDINKSNASFHSNDTGISSMLSSNKSALDSSNMPPPLPPKGEVHHPPPTVPHRESLYETIYNDKRDFDLLSLASSSLNSCNSSHPDTISISSGPSDTSSQNSVQIDKHFAIDDEEGQFMEGSSLLSEEAQRIRELNRRNTMLPPHLRTSYAPEFQDRSLAELRRQTIVTGTGPRENRKDFRRVNSSKDLLAEREQAKTTGITTRSSLRTSTCDNSANILKTRSGSHLRSASNETHNKEEPISVAEVRKVFENKNANDSSSNSSMATVAEKQSSTKTDLKRTIENISGNTNESSVFSQTMSPKLKQRKGLFKTQYQKLTPSKILGRKLDNKIKKVNVNKENRKNK